MDDELMKAILQILNTPDSGSTVPGDPQAESGMAGSSVQPDVRAAYRMKRFMDGMPGGFFIYQADREQKILYANRALYRIFGCDTQEEFQALTGNTFPGMVHPEDVDRVQESIWEQIAQSQYDLDYVEYRIIQKGGKIRWLEDYGHYIQNELLGKIFYVFVSDATEKREIRIREREALLLEKQKREQQLQDQIREYDHELKDIHQEHLRRLEVIEGLSINYESILYANLDTDKILPYRLSSRTSRQFERVFQARSFEEYRLDYVSTWVCQEDQSVVAQVTDPAYIRQKLSECDSYYVNYRALENGKTQYLQLLIAGVGNREHISRVVFGYRRVDDEVRVEMEQKEMLEKALSHAKLANIAKNTFLANMSHDMRTPLNAIAGFTALARTHMEDADRLAMCLDRIEQSGAQLLRLINDVLEVSRVESGTLQIEESKCSLLEMIEEIQDAILPQAEAKEITFSVELSEVKHSDIYSDYGKLTQIFLCLTENAVKYTKRGGWVRMTVKEQATSASTYAEYRFIVEDNGTGISPENQEKVFEPFERGLPVSAGYIPGTGLGLTIAKNFVEMMDGTITVDSVPGKGSRFTVILSLAFQDQSSLCNTEQDLEKTLRDVIGQRKILLVDDNELNLEVETELLEDAGFHVETANDGSVALEKMQCADADHYALILMDIQMPIMNGYEAAWAIRELENPALANIPIIALSANAFEEDRRRSRESGMNAHMAKPFDITRLMKLMVEILGLDVRAETNNGSEARM